MMRSCASLDQSWEEYIDLVTRGHECWRRLDQLSMANDLFNGKKFCRLSINKRKALAGAIKYSEPRESLGKELDILDWALFGSMFGSGYFKQEVCTRNNPKISDALDKIPQLDFDNKTEPVSEEQYFEFVEIYDSSFANCPRPNQFAGASRLLAMKRPDQFVCISNRNREALSQVLGRPKSRKFTLASYWEDAIEPIMRSKWWCKNRPDDPNDPNDPSVRIWSSRAAMFDAVLYSEQ